MACLDAGADPRDAIKRGMYVRRVVRKGRTLHEEIAGRLELQPASTHLVVGGIGSGKTTQLLVAEQRLKSHGDNIALYIDVSTKHDISKLGPKVLLVLAGLRLAPMLDEQARADLSLHLARLREFYNGYGYFQPYYDPPDEEPPPDEDPPEDDEEALGEYVHVPPIIVPPPAEEKLKPVPSEPATILEKIKARLATPTRDFIFLFDSMDRLVDLTRFEQVVVDDLVTMRSLGIGVVIVGPTKLLYGIHRNITRAFDQMHPVTWPDPHNPTELDFLLRVLHTRAPEGILSKEGAMRLVELSGGVLRDLIGIARNAGEEAYLSGDPEITAAHAEIAGEAFGRALLFGLDADELAKLKQVSRDKKFVWTTDKELGLLTSGRVLQYEGSSARYDVHPTILPLLAQLG